MCEYSGVIVNNTSKCTKRSTMQVNAWNVQLVKGKKRQPDFQDNSMCHHSHLFCCEGNDCQAMTLHQKWSSLE